MMMWSLHFGPVVEQAVMVKLTVEKYSSIVARKQRRGRRSLGPSDFSGPCPH
jgi:hypothetical protein